MDPREDNESKGGRCAEVATKEKLQKKTKKIKDSDGKSGFCQSQPWFLVVFLFSIINTTSNFDFVFYSTSDFLASVVNFLLDKHYKFPISL